jgi:hypothetical protein
VFLAEFKRLRSLQNAKKTFAASRSVLKFRVLDLLECVPQRTGGEHLIVHIIGAWLMSFAASCNQMTDCLAGPCVTCLRLAKEGSDMHARVSRLITKGKLSYLQHVSCSDLSAALCKPRTLPSVNAAGAAPYLELWDELCTVALELGPGSSSVVLNCCLSFLLRVLLPLSSNDGQTTPLGLQLSAAFLPLLHKVAQGKGNSAGVHSLFVSHGAFALSMLQPTLADMAEASDVHARTSLIELLLAALRHRDVLQASLGLQTAVAAAAAPLVQALVPLMAPRAAEKAWTKLQLRCCEVVIALVNAAKLPLVLAGMAAVDSAPFVTAGEALCSKGVARGVQDSVRSASSKLKASVDASAAAKPSKRGLASATAPPPARRQKK